MAQFCLATKLTPTEYRKLTFREYLAYIEALTERGPTVEDLF